MILHKHVECYDLFIIAKSWDWRERESQRERESEREQVSESELVS